MSVKTPSFTTSSEICAAAGAKTVSAMAAPVKG